MNNIYECRILIVDDSLDLQEMVIEILHREGFNNADTASSCNDALVYFTNHMPDIIILDIGLPDGDGFSLMQKIRSLSNVPVLFLSARDEDNDKLLGLGLGADDYITKPFLPKELILRIAAILKRTYFPPLLQAKEQENIIHLDERVINFSSGTITYHNEKTVSMTAKEMEILKKLNENRGNIVTFDALSQAVWGDYYYGYENTLMVHVRRLREKIEANPSNPKWLLTVRGVGYKLIKE